MNGVYTAIQSALRPVPRVVISGMPDCFSDLTAPEIPGWPTPRTLADVNSTLQRLPRLAVALGAVVACECVARLPEWPIAIEPMHVGRWRWLRAEPRQILSDPFGTLVQKYRRVALGSEVVGPAWDVIRYATFLCNHTTLNPDDVVVDETAYHFNVAFHHAFEALEALERGDSIGLHQETTRSVREMNYTIVFHAQNASAEVRAAAVRFQANELGPSPDGCVYDRPIQRTWREWFLGLGRVAPELEFESRATSFAAAYVPYRRWLHEFGCRMWWRQFTRRLAFNDSLDDGFEWVPPVA